MEEIAKGEDAQPVECKDDKDKQINEQRQDEY